MNTDPKHGILSLDMVMQELIIALAPMLEFYNELPKNFKDEEIALGQTLRAEAAVEGVAKEKAATDDYDDAEEDEVSPLDIALEKEIYYRTKLLGTTLHASTMGNLLNKYIIPTARTMARGIYANLRNKMTAQIPVPQQFGSFDPGAFGHHNFDDFELMFDELEIPNDGTRWALLGSRYASPLKGELRSGSGLNSNTDDKGTYSGTGLPKYIAGFRIFTTNAFPGELYLGSGNSIGLVTSLPYAPPEGSQQNAQYFNSVNPTTGIAIQTRHIWKTDPKECWDLLHRLYVGHKVLFPSQTFKYQQAAI